MTTRVDRVGRDRNTTLRACHDKAARIVARGDQQAVDKSLGEHSPCRGARTFPRGLGANRRATFEESVTGKWPRQDRPEASVATPSEITYISWTFPWTGSGTPFPMDVVLDDLSFIP
jgi:hypothetical protein